MSEVKISDTCRGSHDGQTDMTIYATIDGIVHGYLDYSIFQNEIYIEMIEVTEEHKREGIATKMMHYLRLKNNGEKIRPGMTSETGTPFWKSYKSKYMKSNH